MHVINNEFSCVIGTTLLVIKTNNIISIFIFYSVVYIIFSSFFMQFADGNIQVAFLTAFSII